MPGGSRRLAFRLFIGLVTVNAATGIAVLVAGGFGPTGGRILTTSLTLTAGVLLALACGTGQRAPLLRRSWLVGVAGTAIGFGLLVVGIWIEPGQSYWKLDWSIIVVAVGFGLVSLVSLPTLPERHHWTLTAATLLTTILVVLLDTAIWGEWSTSWFWRLFGALAVALAAFVLVIPVLHRARPVPSPVSGEDAAALLGFCPSCGRDHPAPADTVTVCPGCGARYCVHPCPARPTVGDTTSV